MKICVLFYNLGGYHLARLDAAHAACLEKGWGFSAIEVVESTAEHPWGSMERPGYVKTLMPFRDDKGLPTVGNPERLTAALEEAQPNVLVIPGWGYDFSRQTISWGCKNKCRLILMSESKRDDARRNFVKEKIKKHIWVKKFQAALVGGQKHVDYLIKLGMPRDKVFTGYDVVDNEFFRSGVQKAREKSSSVEQRSQSIPYNKFFLSANRFIERKNLPRLIESFSAAINSGKMNESWDLVLLGSGTSEQAKIIEKAVAASGVAERIHLPGFVKYDQICEWYAAASAFVHPALSEQWGLVVNEAMAASLPILLSNTCGCHPELVDEGINGFSFDPADGQQLAERLIQMANSDLKSLGEASAAKIENEFSAASFGRGLVNAINSLDAK